MKLSDLKSQTCLARPEVNSIEDGVYLGAITTAQFVERECNYNADQTRVMLNLKIQVKDSEGEMVDLFHAVNYSWSKRGYMVPLLENLDALPNPGESIRLDDLVGIPVKVSVENTTKDDETYSNIISIRKVEGISSNDLGDRAKPRKRIAKPSDETMSSHQVVKVVLDEDNDREKDLDDDLDLD